MPSREVKVAIIGDPSSLQRALRTADAGVSSFQSKMQTVGARLQTVGASMTRNLTLPLVGFGVVAFRELNAGAEALAQTQAVIESTGGAARQSVDDIVALASELSDLSSIDDEDIQGMLNKLLTFTDIAPSQFDETALAVADLSIAMGQDLTASAVQVGKALNNPLRGLTSLQRVGVNFTDEQREMIEIMVAFGDTAGAQRIILAELNREFGGSAGAFGTTPAARLRRLTQRFEELGASILEDVLPILEDFGGIIDTLADKFDNLTPTQQKWVSGLILAAAVAGPLVSVVGALATAFAFLAGTGGLVLLVAAAVVALGVALYVLISNWDKVTEAAASFFRLVISSVPGARTTVMALFQAINFVASALGRVTSIAGTVISTLTRLGQVALSGVIAAIQTLTGNLSGAAQSAANLLSTLTSIGSTSVAKDPVAVVGDSMNSRSADFIPKRSPGRAGPTSEQATAQEGFERAFRKVLREEVQLVKAV